MKSEKNTKKETNTSDNLVFLDETPEQTEVLDELMTLISVLVSEFVDIDPLNPPLDVPVKTLFDNDAESFGIFLSKLHLYYSLEINYVPYSEFELFEDLNEVFQHFGERVLMLKGLWV